MRTFRIREGSMCFNAPIALVLALAMWLQSAAGLGRAGHMESAVEGVVAAAPATSALPVRFAESARGARHYDAGSFPAVLQPGFVDLQLVGPRRSVTPRSGFDARHALALSFPYDATAPPAFLHK
jgi:hypothetical protein